VKRAKVVDSLRVTNNKKQLYRRSEGVAGGRGRQQSVGFGFRRF